MRTRVLEELNAENRLAYLRSRFTDGLRDISTSPAKVVLVTLYWVVALLLLAYLKDRYPVFFEDIAPV